MSHLHSFLEKQMEEKTILLEFAMHHLASFVEQGPMLVLSLLGILLISITTSGVRTNTNYNSHDHDGPFSSKWL